jgi:vacuolar-type H+-ATPase subunit C/Vma6
MIRERAPRVHAAAGRDFVLGRLAGIRAALLGVAGLRDLVGRDSSSDRHAVLRTTAWAVAAEGRSDEDVVAALESRAREAVAGSLRDLPPGARDLVLAYLLPEDVRAVRGALRAVAAGLPAERAAPLLEPSPALGRERLRELASCTDVRGLDARLEAWGSPLAGAASAACPDLRKPGALLVAETALHAAGWHAAFRAVRGPGADRRVVRELLSARADLAAASTLLSLAGEPGRDAIPIRGGKRLDAAGVARIAALPGHDVPGAVAAALRDLLAGVTDPAAALGSPSLADHVLGRAAVRHARRVARRHPLTVAVPCAFAAEVLEELRRIRLVLRATAEGFPPGALLDLLEA